MLKRVNGEYKLMSVSNPGKVLKNFGTKKPSKAAVIKEEKRVASFSGRGILSGKM